MKNQRQKVSEKKRKHDKLPCFSHLPITPKPIRTNLHVGRFLIS